MYIYINTDVGGAGGLKFSFGYNIIGCYCIGCFKYLTIIPNILRLRPIWQLYKKNLYVYQMFLPKNEQFHWKCFKCPVINAKDCRVSYKVPSSPREHSCTSSEIIFLFISGCPVFKNKICSFLQVINVTVWRNSCMWFIARSKKKIVCEFPVYNRLVILQSNHVPRIRKKCEMLVKKQQKTR